MDILLFVDTGLEFPQMYEHIDKLEQYLQFPIMRLKPPHTFEYLFYEYAPPRKKSGAGGTAGAKLAGAAVPVVYRKAQDTHHRPLSAGVEKRSSKLFNTLV